MRLIEKQEEVKEQQKAEAEAERLKRATRINNAAQSGTVGSASFDNSNFARRSVARDSLAGNGPPGVTDPFRRQGSRRRYVLFVALLLMYISSDKHHYNKAFNSRAPNRGIDHLPW